MEEVKIMATKYMTQIESREDALEILEQYQRNYFLAEIDIKPELSTNGHITNIDKFIQIKNKPNFRSGSGNPVHKIYIAAPKAVSVILEAIDEMNASIAEKQLLFDIYISETKTVEDVNSEELNEALDAFTKVYKGSQLEGPKGCR